MASSTPSNDSHSYSEMSKGDVEAIGAHCQMEYCNILDFLPFKCQSCNGMYCLDHRTEHAHKCPKEGDWARKKTDRASSKSSLPKPSLLTHDQQCHDPSCKTLINTARMPANHCTTCNRSYCLKHRMMEDHNCKNLIPLGARPSVMTEGQKTVKSALSSFRSIWGNKQKELKGKQQNLADKFKTKEEKNAAERLRDLNELKKTAKGEASIPTGKRVYLHVEASADTTKAKFPTGKFFYNKEWNVGRVLDVAAKALQVENVNNRGGGDVDKLRVFHVEGGRLLKFSEKIGDPCASGNRIVLLRGVSDADPDLIDL